MNAHDAVLAAVLTALRLPTPVTTGAIEEEIDAAGMPEDQAQAVSVALVGSVPSVVAINGAPVDWVSHVAIDCAARSDGRTPAGRASRALHAAVYARLMADTTLAGAASYIGEPQISQDQALLGTRIGRTSGLYTVHHRTAARTLEAPA